jgi:hypothetical protein
VQRMCRCSLLRGVACALLWARAMATRKKSSKKTTGNKKSSKRSGKKAGKKVARAMDEMNSGTLRSGRSKKKVKSRKQAIAIGLSEARSEGAKVPRKKSSKKTSKKSGGRSKGRATR